MLRCQNRSLSQEPRHNLPSGRSPSSPGSATRFPRRPIASVGRIGAAGRGAGKAQRRAGAGGGRGGRAARKRPAARSRGPRPAGSMPAPRPLSDETSPGLSETRCHRGDRHALPGGRLGSADPWRSVVNCPTAQHQRNGGTKYPPLC